MRCDECKCVNDHTWWCLIGANDGTRNYYWQKGRLEDLRAAVANRARSRA